MVFKRIVKLLDYVFVLRPTLFLPVWTVYTAGYFAVLRVAPATTNGQAGNTGIVSWSLLVFLTLLMGSAYILNQLCDVETDSRNGKLFLISQRHISPRAAWIELVGLLIISILAALYHDEKIGLLFIAIFVLTGILYSVSPFQWKDHPFLGLFANALGAILIFFAGWWSVRADFLMPMIHAAPYTFAVAAVYLYTTLLDIEGDAVAAKETFGVKYGWNITLRIGTVLVLLAAALAYLNHDSIILYPALLAVPFFIYATVRQRRGDVARAIKIPILLLALAICIKACTTIVFLICFLCSKWYYRHRFGMNYPNLKTD